MTGSEWDHIGSKKERRFGDGAVMRVARERASPVVVALRRDDPTAAIGFAWGRHERERVPVRPFGNNWRRETAD